MPAAHGLAIGSIDRTLVEALRARDVEVVAASNREGVDLDASPVPDVVCVSFSVATGLSLPIEALRERFSSAAILLSVPASEVLAGNTIARELDADVVASPIDTRRAAAAIDRILARRAREAGLAALVPRVAALDSALAAEVQALGRDREQKARALDEALAFRSSMLANLAHEVRTPLAVVQGFVELLDEDFGGVLDADQRELLRGIRTGSGQLVTVFQGLVDLARAETGNVDRRPASVFLPELLGDAVRKITPATQHQPIRLSLDVDRRLGWVRTEPDWLRQIVACLLSNAVKFTREGEIRLVARTIDESGGDVDPVSALVRSPTALRSAFEIEITDTGCGIDPRQQARIFEAFQQEDASMTRKHEGMGIGLTIVRELAREIGATLSLESRQGSGTSVRLRVPFDRIRDRTEVGGRPALPARAPVAGDAGTEPLTEIARLYRLEPSSLGDALPLALHALDRIVGAQVALFAAREGRDWRVEVAGQGAAGPSRPALDVYDRAAREGRASVEGGDDERWLAIAVRSVSDELLGVLVCLAPPSRESAAWATLQTIGGWLGLVHTARRLSADRVELAAVLSRSVKDPLGALLAYTQVLLRNLRGSLTDEQRTIVLRLEKGIHRAILGALDILDHERARSGGAEVERRTVSLARVVDHVLGRHAAALELERIRIDRSIPEDTAECLGDEIRTDRAISTIVRAITDGLSPGEAIAFAARTRGGFATLEIGAAVAERSAFARAFGDPTPPFALDDGLGLALARRAIEAQGGRVTLVDGHTLLVVSLTLPRSDAA